MIKLDLLVPRSPATTIHTLVQLAEAFTIEDSAKLKLSPLKTPDDYYNQPPAPAPAAPAPAPSPFQHPLRHHPLARQPTVPDPPRRFNGHISLALMADPSLGPASFWTQANALLRKNLTYQVSLSL
uniref:Uncharacterized protein n=1 Tax=Fagus sylvatica TaxID=28930 RepID=A0A2N9EXB1_FAGSY